jgi:hypothetical protein
VAWSLRSDAKGGAHRGKCAISECIERQIEQQIPRLFHPNARDFLTARVPRAREARVEDPGSAPRDDSFQGFPFGDRGGLGSEALVRRRSIDRRNLRFVQPKINRQLAAVVGHVGEDVRDLLAAGRFPERFASHH